MAEPTARLVLVAAWPGGEATAGGAQGYAALGRAVMPWTEVVLVSEATPASTLA